MRRRTDGLAHSTLTAVLFCVVLQIAAPRAARAAEPAPPPTLSVGYAFEENSFQRRLLGAFATGLQNSKVARLRPVGSQSLGNSDRDLLRAVRNGRLDMAIVPFAAIAEESPSFGLFTTPFVFDDLRHLRAVQRSRIGQDLLQELRPTTNVKGIGWWAGEFAAIVGEDPVLEPADLVNRSIGFQQKSEDGRDKASVIPSLSRAMGAFPVPMPPSSPEAPFTAAGVELVETTPLQLRRVAEAPKFISLTNHVNTGSVVVVNPAKWDRLSVASQDALIRAFEFANQATTQEFQRQEVSLIERAPGNAAVLSYTAADRAQWVQATRGISAGDAGLQLLIEKARGYPVTQLVSTSAPPGRVSWNFWTEDGQDRDVSSLTVGRISRINIDLGRLPYRRFQTGTPDDRVMAALFSGDTRLLVQPILLGAQIEIAPGHDLKPQLMSLSVKNAAVQTSDDDKRQAYWDGRLSTRSLAAMLGLGNVLQWSVRANQSGCADIAFVVWDEARTEPLDHVVVTVPVIDPGGPPVDCYGKPRSSELAAGLGTLLRPPNAAETVADAALHVFEYSTFGTTRSIAVLVHARRLAAARGSAASIDPGIYSWELATPLSSYVSEPAQLPRLISEAHQRLAKGNPKPYDDVVGDLAGVLFSGRTERDAAQGQLAAEALKDAVASGSPARVLMRLVHEGGKAMYLPLGLLAAGASKPFVDKRFTVIQSLPGAPVAASACIGRWHVARSLTLQGAAGTPYTLLSKAPSKLPVQASLMSTHKDLAAYLGSQPEGKGAEGFIILAHHDGGSLRFSSQDRSPAWIRSNNINRRFNPGSLGVLAACTTSGSSQQTSLVVDRLASQRISSVILSPFAVDIEYGVRLALAFERQVLKEIATPTRATAAVLFERSASDVAGSLPAGAGLKDMALEFQLVGDPDLKVCAEQEE